MNNVFSLTPLLRTTVGFDRLNGLFESLNAGEDPSDGYPPYNIEKRDEDRYGITMAVAGFTEKDLSITADRDRLIVSGRINRQSDDEVEYLYHGMATSAFERIFRLADHMKVTGAQIKDGLLSIELLREIPEEQKPRTILIKGANDQRNIEHSAASNTSKVQKQVA